MLLGATSRSGVRRWEAPVRYTSRMVCGGRRALTGFAVVAGFAYAGSLALADGSGSAALRTIVLRASQVGRGYSAQPTTALKSAIYVGGGKSVCVRSPKSAATGAVSFGRTFIRRGSPEVSNELVRYRSASALAEVVDALHGLVARCPSLELKVGSGVTARLRFSRATSLGLLSGSVLLREVIARTVNGRTYLGGPLYAIYQTTGRILSLVTADGSDARQVRATVARAAAASALNLR